MTPTIPDTLGACADLLYEVRAQKREAQKVVDKLAEQESALRDHLIEMLPASDATGVMGAVCKVHITTKTIPTVKDWDQFYAHIWANRDFSFLQRRVGDAAIRERWEAGETVPGVEPYIKKDVSVTKI